MLALHRVNVKRLFQNNLSHFSKMRYLAGISKFPDEILEHIYIKYHQTNKYSVQCLCNI